MSTEHLLREFYNEMYRIHTQPGNAYDVGDHLYHLTVHKHLDQDPLIQFREAFRWVDQSGPDSSPMPDAVMEVSPSSWRIKPRLSQSMGIP